MGRLSVYLPHRFPRPPLLIVSLGAQYNIKKKSIFNCARCTINKLNMVRLGFNGQSPQNQDARYGSANTRRPTWNTVMCATGCSKDTRPHHLYITDRAELIPILSTTLNKLLKYRSASYNVLPSTGNNRLYSCPYDPRHFRPSCCHD